MARTPLASRRLPDYTPKEERLNSITHIIGAGLAIVCLVLGVIKAVLTGDAWKIVSMSVYGFSLLLVYVISGVYHGLHRLMAKKIMQVIDHCGIYALIAGTYTPILLVAIRSDHAELAWLMFGIEWGMAMLSATLNAIDLKKYAVFSMITYVCMGWLIILIAPIAAEAIGVCGFTWLLAGGIAYSVGAVLYGVGIKKHYIHSVFHMFVIVGSMLQFISIFFFIL